mmetsp:Transcript_21877/g.70439  ORF Transcript_21877/g.70439 Transcript_21877/m.70439 type:complete len:236 (+) Transcript_21877:2326-3033(+)
MRSWGAFLSTIHVGMLSRGASPARSSSWRASGHTSARALKLAFVAFASFAHSKCRGVAWRIAVRAAAALRLSFAVASRSFGVTRLFRLARTCSAVIPASESFCRRRAASADFSIALSASDTVFRELLARDASDGTKSPRPRPRPVVVVFVVGPSATRWGGGTSSAVSSSSASSRTSAAPGQSWPTYVTWSGFVATPQSKCKAVRPLASLFLAASGSRSPMAVSFSVMVSAGSGRT